METEEKSREWKKGVMKTGWTVAMALVVCYLATIIPMILVGIDTITVPTVAAVALGFLYPILFFFFGMFVVMKKKIFPHTTQRE